MNGKRLKSKKKPFNRLNKLDCLYTLDAYCLNTAYYPIMKHRSSLDCMIVLNIIKTNKCKKNSVY